MYGMCVMVSVGALMLAAAGLSSAKAQGSGDLAQQAQNPIANLISVPFQNNTNFNVGRLDNDQNILNIQPVIPFKLNEDWNLVTRWILPVVYQPPVYQGDDTDFGLGNFNPSFFFVKQVNPKLMIGAGPTFLCRPAPTGVSGLTNGVLAPPPQSYGRRANGWSARSSTISGLSPAIPAIRT